MVKDVSVTMVRTCKGARRLKTGHTEKASRFFLKFCQAGGGGGGGASRRVSWEGQSEVFPAPAPPPSHRPSLPAALHRAYHIAFGGVLQGLDHFQPLLESHLLNQIGPDSSKFLERRNFGVSEKNVLKHAGSHAQTGGNACGTGRTTPSVTVTRKPFRDCKSIM